MGDERPQINQPFRHQRDGLGIRLAVPELEADVDFAERGVGEWVLLRRLVSESDDKDGAAEARCLECPH